MDACMMHSMFHSHVCMDTYNSAVEDLSNLIKLRVHSFTCTCSFFYQIKPSQLCPSFSRAEGLRIADCSPK